MNKSHYLLRYSFLLKLQQVHTDVEEFIPLIMTTITLQPTPSQKAHNDFNKEVFVDFMWAQIKTLSFLAYIIKLYQEVSSFQRSHCLSFRPLGDISFPLAGCGPAQPPDGPGNVVPVDPMSPRGGAP